MGWTCGGFSADTDKNGNHVIYCGQCPDNQYCIPDPVFGAGVGTCGGTNPLAYGFQKQKTRMLVSMGENDTPVTQYGYAQNIGDGRGYTVGSAGFTTGTGDFIIVALCYNMAEPNNVLQKYWSALTYYNDQYVATGNNQGDTTKIDAIGNFVKDVATAAAEAPDAGQLENAFQNCQDSYADAVDLGAAAAHMAARGMQLPLTAGFLYDTELNFGDQSDQCGDAGTPGTVDVMAAADKDYGAGLPTNFAGKPWEESKWLGYVIKERTLVMVGNSTWKTDIDQNATWEAARRMNTPATNSPESATTLDMDFDFVSAYQAGAAPPTPCWSGLPDKPQASAATVYTLTTDKTAGASSENLWKAAWSQNSAQNYANCPANPTP
jgi:hypothetical protein